MRILNSAVFCAAALALLLSGCAANRPTPSGASAQGSPFAFHDQFWVNLHQRLYAESSERFPNKEPQAGAADFTEDERGKWEAALAFYRTRIPVRGPLTFFEAPLSTWNEAVANVPDEASPAQAGVEPELAAHLVAAAEVYRAHGFGADHASNERWISEVNRRLSEHGRSAIAKLERIYGTPLRIPLEVQVSVQAGFLGAYTTDQGRISINSGMPRYQGDFSLEMVLHEASHTLIDPTTKALEEECGKQGKPVPASLWHALLFFSTGEVIRGELPGYTPYAYANGLYERSWPTLEPLLRAHWLPYVEGKATREDALRALVAGLPSAGE